MKPLPWDQEAPTFGNLPWSGLTSSKSCTAKTVDIVGTIWINDVEMVESMEELTSSRSVFGKNFPILRCWTRRLLLLLIRSSIIPSSRRRSASRNRKPRKRTGFHEEGRSPSWSTTTFVLLVLMIQFLTMLIDSLITLRNDNVRDEILLSMTKNPSDDILESLDTLRTRESDQLKNVLELYYMEIQQKISMPNNQRLKTMMKTSINQKLRLRNFDARDEKNRNKCRGQESQGLSCVERGKIICYQWKEKGQCSKGDQCSFRHESNDRAKPTPNLQKHEVAVVSRKGNARDRSLSEKSNRLPCKYFLKCTCTKSPRLFPA